MKTGLNFKKDEVPFTQVANNVLSDKSLSMQAKGLYAYLYSKPPNWQFSYERISQEMENGTKAVLTAIKELERAKLLKRLKQSDGRTIYWVTFPPDNFVYLPSTENRQLGNEKPSAEKAYLPKSQVAKNGTISNKDFNTNKEEDTNKENTTTEQSSGDISLVIKAFEGVNPSARAFYARPPQRNACQSLIEFYTLDRVLSVIEKTLPKTNKIEYMPTITSPIQLFEKWSSLEAAIIKLKGKTTTEEKKKGSVIW